MVTSSIQDGSSDELNFPQSLNSLEDLRQHFRAEFDGLTTVQIGDRFVQFVQKLIPQTDIGHNFEQPEINERRSNDGGVDLVAQSKDGRSVLYIQAKFTVDRAETIDNVISKFQNFQVTNSSPKASGQGTLELDSQNMHFLLVTLSPLDGVIKSYTSKHFGSKKFYDSYIVDNKMDFIHGSEILSILRVAYRKTHHIPANLSVNLATVATNVGNVFFGIISGNELQRLYREFGDALFFENIRDFLGLTKERVGRTTPNQEIIKTIKDTPERMLERNNGIVIKAETIKSGTFPTELVLTKGSIVNGCQTTMCVVDYAVRECFIPVKIVQTDNSWDVAKAANYQNSVEAIDLDLARFLRPQIVKRAAAASGIKLEDGTETPLQILDQIYDRRVAYDETRLLYIGLFSRNPNNLFAGNYTDLLGELLKRFEGDASYEDQVFGTLFDLQGASMEGLKSAEQTFRHASYASKFKRLYSEVSPVYRSYISILALCGSVDINIADRANDNDVEFKRMQSFFESAKVLLLNRRKIFVKYYVMAVKTWMQAVYAPDSDEASVQRDMNSISKRQNFTNLFAHLNMNADADEALQQMKENMTI